MADIASCIVVIPAFEPGAALAAFAADLAAQGFAHIVVVDDGSSAEAQTAFQSAARVPGCVVVRLASNGGKGAALKAALGYAAAHFPKAAGLLTADADGQHCAADCRRVAERFLSCPDTLCLGVRTFSWKTTPFRSWWGNRFTSLLFALLFGRYVADTQTGLRAFASSQIPFFRGLSGEGYEYEMRCLCRAVRRGLRVSAVPVRTIYVANNGSSHFHPLRDTWRINRALFAAFLGRD